MLVFAPNWLSGASDHPCNTEDAIRDLFKNRFNILRTHGGWADTVRGLALGDGDTVRVYKGIHQEKFGSSNPRDQVRIDQSHFNVFVQGRPCHVYVEPYVSRYEITEITNPPPAAPAVAVAAAAAPAPMPAPAPVPAPPATAGALPIDPVMASVLRMSGAFG